MGVIKRLAFAAMVLAPLCAASAAAPFRLASQDGRSWVAPGKFGGKPSVFLFWDIDCAPCLGELKDIAALRAAWPEAELVIVSLSPRAGTARVLAQYDVPASVIRAVAPSDPKGLLARLGNREGALPFTSAFTAVGKPCATSAGRLDAGRMRALARRC